MKMIQNGIEGVLEKHRIIPVVTLNTSEEVHVVAQKLKAENIFCAEITLRTDFALEGIAQMKQEYPEIAVGVGTVVNAEQVEEVRKIGVDFLVSPGASPSLLSIMEQSGIPYLPGAVTPSEIVAGMEKNVYFFKFFPAELFGGKALLNTYAQVFPKCKFCPTGGLNAQNYEEFLALPNVRAVGGSWMLK